MLWASTISIHDLFVCLFCDNTQIGNNGIDANFLFPYICSFLHYLHLLMLVNVKLDTSWYKRNADLILNGTPKTEVAILAFLHCGEFVKNSIEQL